ncbi:MAG: hypothetical protein AAF515_17980 [Pseudomonadota bacterium]
MARSLVSVALALALAGCTGTAATQEAAPSTEPAPAASPPQERPKAIADVPAATAPSGDPQDAGLAAAELAAVADLEQRLQGEPIEVMRSERVTWPNGALGCPKPGVMVTQALVPGTRVVLRAAGRDYAYHGARDRAPRLCERPAKSGSTLPVR